MQDLKRRVQGCVVVRSNLMSVEDTADSVLADLTAAINRDYPVMFAALYFFTLLGLLMNLVGDLMYVVIDPRIDFERREG